MKLFLNRRTDRFVNLETHSGTLNTAFEFKFKEVDLPYKARTTSLLTVEYRYAIMIKNKYQADAVEFPWQQML